MLKGSLLFLITYVTLGLQAIYIGPPSSNWHFASRPPAELTKRIILPRPNLFMRMPNIGLIIPKFVTSRYNMMQQPPYNPNIIPRSDLSTANDPSTEILSLDMMRQTAPFKKMDAFGNVVIYEALNGEKVLYRPPNDKLLVNSFYIPYYNKYLATDYMIRLQRLRAYVNNYNYLTTHFLNGLSLYPYDDQLNYYRRLIR